MSWSWRARTAPFVRSERMCAVLLSMAATSLTWGRYNILTALFFVSLCFLVSNYLFDSFLRSVGLQKKISAFLSLFAPAVSPLLTLTNNFICLTDTSRTLHNDSFCDASPSIEREISTIVDHIISDYIPFWYRVVSPDDEEFVEECRTTFNHMFVTFAKQELGNIRTHRFLTQALNALRNHVLSSGTEMDAEELQHEEEKAVHLMSSIAEYWLTTCGPQALNRMNGNMSLNTSGPQQRDSVYVMVKEMLTFGVLMPITYHISDPRLLFQSIISLVSAAEVDSKDQIDSSSKEKNAISALEKDSLSLANGLNPEQSPSSLSPQADDGVVGDKRHGLSTRLSYDADTGLEKGLEVSDDHRLFQSIRISDTRTVGVKGDFYVEYQVTYDGLFEVIERIVSQEKTVSCLVRQEVSVWRRFSEFLSLHQTLEGNHALRSWIRDVENPVRLKTVTSLFGSKLNRNVTTQRRMFLVRYLNRLADIPVVANSPQFRTFMGYETHTSGSRGNLTSRSSALKSMISSRLDKVITDGIRGAVSIIRTVIPIESYQDGYLARFSSPSAGPRIETQFGDELQLSSSLRSDGGNKLTKLTADHVTYGRETSQISANFILEAMTTEVQSVPNEKPVSDDNQALRERETTDGCNSRSSDLLVELFEVIRSEGKTAHESVSVFLLKGLLGDFFETIVEQVVNFHCTEETCILLLHSMHRNIWTSGPCDDHVTEVDEEHATRVVVNWIKSQAFYTRFLPLDVDKFVRYAITCLKSHERNQLLLYDLISILFHDLRSTD